MKGTRKHTFPGSQGEPVDVFIKVPEGVDEKAASEYTQLREEARTMAKHSGAADAASEADAKWFADHPKREFRLRRIIPNELGPSTADWVLVAQIAPGMRQRAPIPPEFSAVCEKLEPKQRKIQSRDWVDMLEDIWGPSPFTELLRKPKGERRKAFNMVARTER